MEVGDSSLYTEKCPVIVADTVTKLCLTCRKHWPNLNVYLLGNVASMQNYGQEKSNGISVIIRRLLLLTTEE